MEESGNESIRRKNNSSTSSSLSSATTSTATTISSTTTTSTVSTTTLHRSPPSTSKAYTIELLEISFRSDDYVKRLEHISAKGNILLCRHVNVNKEPLYQVILRRDPTGAFSIYSTRDSHEAEKIFKRLHSVFDPLEPYLIIKTRGRLIRILRSIVDTSLTHADWTWLHIAAYLDFFNVFQQNSVTLQRDLNNHDNQENMTPLLVAIKSGKSEIVKSILTFEPDLTLLDAEGNNCLHLASLGTFNLFRLVLKEANRRYGLTLLEQSNNMGYTPFQLACFHEKTPTIHELLKLGLPIRLLTLASFDPDTGLRIKPQPLSSKHNQTQIVFTQEMISDLDTSEAKYGGNPLHWCKKRKLMVTLIEIGFNLNSLNLINETPVHTMIRKFRLDCLLPLLNAGARVDVAGPNGSRALHFAVEYGFHDGFRSLIVYGANINDVNSAGQSIRHCVAHETGSHYLDMLYALHKLDATRCSKDKTDCLEGCSANGSFIGQPQSYWPENITYQYDCHANANQTRRRPSLIARLGRHRSPTKDRKKVNMLCIDGGGMKGLFAIQTLIELQKQLDKPFIDYFDWIGATSTGAIIGSSLVIGRSLDQLRQDYFELKNEIFNQKRPHNAEALEAILQRKIGPDRKLSSVTPKKMMITSILADRDPPKLYLLRSYQPICDSNKWVLMEGETPREADDITIWEAIRASSAAPAFFKPYGPFIDGGLVSNNPTLDCLSEFFNYNHAYDTESESHAALATEYGFPEQLNLVLSVGSGKPRPTPVVNYDFGNMTFRRNPVGAFRTAIKYMTLGELMVKLTTHPDSHVVARARTWCASLQIPYYRLNPPLGERLPLDETRDDKLVEGMLRSKVYMYSIRDKVKEIVDAIKSAQSS